MFIEIHVSVISEIILAGISTLFFLGHNLWLVGKKDSIKLRVSANTGDNFPESDSAVKPERVADFRLVTPDGFSTITNYRVEANSLVAEVPIINAQPLCAALALYAHPITLEAKKFGGYIAEENAEASVEASFSLEKTITPQRESYTKFAKFLWENEAAPPDNIAKLIAGHQLEIVPQTAPSKIGEEQKLSVKVLFEGEPISGLRVSNGCEKLNGGKYLTHTVTDENGMAEVIIQSPGHWFIRTHYIRRHVDQTNFDWESFWASVTFEV